MKICYVGKQLKQCGVGNIFSNDVHAFVKLGHEVQAIDTSAEEFRLSRLDPDVDLIIVSADLNAARKIWQSGKSKRALLFVHGRMDNNLDPQEDVSYSPLKVVERLDSVAQIAARVSPISVLWSKLDICSKLKQVFRFQGDSYRGVYAHWLNTIRRFGKVVVPCNFFGDQLKQSLGIDYCKIPYGLDHSYWKPDKEYETDEGYVRIIVPTGFFIFKRLSIGLKKIDRVARELKKKIRIETDFIWYNADYKELREKIQARYPQITFRDGTSDPKSLFSKYDLMVHPSLGDAAPQVVVECCALGLPVLASTLSEDYTGPHLYHVKTTDPRYEDVLRTLILNAQLRLELSKKARSFAVKWISWEDRARMILQLRKKI